jgi:DivIVA domain-containing protein
MRSTVPLTPADIHNVAFGKAPIGKRGYNEEDVDALLDEVSEEMILLLEENDSLQRRIGRSAESDLSAESELSAVAAELRSARQACDEAERTARALQDQLGRARRAGPAAPAGGLSSQDVERVLAMAQSTADESMREVQERSRTLLAEARSLCERTIREAQAAARDLENDARRRHSEATAEAQRRRAAVLEEIDGLTRLAREYHAALVAHLTRQEQHLSGALEVRVEEHSR